MKPLVYLLMFSILVFAGTIRAEDQVLVATSKDKRTTATSSAANSSDAGKEINSTADLYAAMPVEAKKSEVVGDIVKTYTGDVTLICAKSTKICIITFLKKK